MYLMNENIENIEKITEGVRKFPVDQKISEEHASQAGLEQKARKFRQAGAEIYSKA